MLKQFLSQEVLVRKASNELFGLTWAKAGWGFPELIFWSLEQVMILESVYQERKLRHQRIPKHLRRKTLHFWSLPDNSEVPLSSSWENSSSLSFENALLRSIGSAMQRFSESIQTIRGSRWMGSVGGLGVGWGWCSPKSFLFRIWELPVFPRVTRPSLQHYSSLGFGWLDHLGFLRSCPLPFWPFFWSSLFAR